jgi:hypothetical protein
MARANTQIYQLYIELNEVRPAIWRRFQVAGDITLFKLHEYIQVFMGWENCHMHEFRIKGKRYGMPDPEGEAMFGTQVCDDKKYKLCDLAADGDEFVYVYDFGDDWHHTVKVEKVLGPEEGVKYPMCMAGERACPPEDCSGPWGYEEMLEVLKNPKHREYKHYCEWLGGEFDPEWFDLKRVNGFFRKSSK